MAGKSARGTCHLSGGRLDTHGFPFVVGPVNSIAHDHIFVDCQDVIRFYPDIGKADSNVR